VGVASNELDSLFAAPPAGFIAERKRIVAALKGAGRKDDAKEVEKIPRPSLALWTVNQVARRDPELVRHLVEITERLQSAPGPEYAAAAVEHRQVLHQLRDRASEILSGAGHELTPQVILRAIANLRVAAGSAEARATLEQGRMVQDVAEQASDSLFGTAAIAALTDGATSSEAAANAESAPPSTGPAETTAPARPRTKEVIEAERAVKRLRAAEAAALKKVERAERAVASTREALAVAEVHAATARADAAAARADADAATQAREAGEAALARYR